MARADLHYALAVDEEIYTASRVDPSVLDPIVRVSGGVPGDARPFVVVRNYQGPQGFYTERFLIRDPQGRQVHDSGSRRIELQGEMFEDRFATRVGRLDVDTVGEYSMTFFIDDAEVGTIPVFIEAGGGGDLRVAAEETFKSAIKKGEILWVSVPQPPRGRKPVKAHTQPVWFHSEGGKIYLLTGPGEQDVPGLADASTVEIIARSKDLRSRVTKVSATVHRLPSDSDEFAKIAEKMLSGRLNLPDGDAALERWRRDCAIVELTPLFRSEPAPAA